MEQSYMANQERYIPSTAERERPQTENLARQDYFAAWYLNNAAAALLQTLCSTPSYLSRDLSLFEAPRNGKKNPLLMTPFDRPPVSAALIATPFFFGSSHYPFCFMSPLG